VPSYSYNCPLCNTDYTEIRGILEEEKPIQCENCKVDYIRVFSAPVVSFNGTGFYATDKKGK
jgi:putative FmdB family regulatory protein